MTQSLFLIWQDPKSRVWFPIGCLTYDGKHYQFFYTYGAKKAQEECGFESLYSFPVLEKVYTSSELFPLFANRLMRSSRPDYKNYVEWLNIPEHKDDPIAILARSGGKKATDTLTVFPCPEPDENGLYHIHFFANGLRYFEQSSIERVNHLQKNEVLDLVPDPENPKDPLALRLRTQDLVEVGYCPRYLVSDLHKLLQKNPELIQVKVERVNPAPTPIQFRLLCNMTAEWPKEFRPFSGQEYQPLVNLNQPLKK